MDDHGFTISGANLRGPVIVFPEFALLWNVECWDKVTIESFIPIWCLKPHVGEWEAVEEELLRVPFTINFLFLCQTLFSSVLEKPFDPCTRRSLTN